MLLSLQIFTVFYLNILVEKKTFILQDESQQNETEKEAKKLFE